MLLFFWKNLNNLDLNKSIREYSYHRTSQEVVLLEYNSKVDLYVHINVTKSNMHTVIQEYGTNYGVALYGAISIHSSHHCILQPRYGL